MHNNIYIIKGFDLRNYVYPLQVLRRRRIAEIRTMTILKTGFTQAVESHNLHTNPFFSFLFLAKTPFQSGKALLSLHFNDSVMKSSKHAGASYKFGIGSNIRKWRNLKDIKQKELAVSLRLSEAAVSNIENDLTNITIGQLEDISIALDVSIEQLLSDPRDKCGTYIMHSQYMAQKNDHKDLDREVLTAIISSLEKKDQQLQTIMQQFLQVIGELTQKENSFFNSSKQVASRA